MRHRRRLQSTELSFRVGFPAPEQSLDRYLQFIMGEFWTLRCDSVFLRVGSEKALSIDES